MGALNREIKAHYADKGESIELHEFTIERQCNETFFFDLDTFVGDYDAVLTGACGAGVQFVADRYPKLPVFPMDACGT